MIKTAAETGYERRYREMQATVARMTDKLGLPVDAGIVETVVLLNLFGIPTSASCEGHLEHGTGAPWVDIEATGVFAQMEVATRLFQQATLRKQELGRVTEEVLQLFEWAHSARLELKRAHVRVRQRLFALLIDFYAQRSSPFDQHLIVQSRPDGKSRLESQGADMQEVLEPSEREQKLRAYQREMQSFTAFLRTRYFAGHGNE